MDKILIKELVAEDVVSELKKIGFDNGYASIASEKFQYKNLKICNLTVAQANIIKQTALTVGADLATNKDVVTGKIELSDAILCGSISQIKKIAEKLKKQPFGLKTVALYIEELINEPVKKTKIVGILNVTPDSFSDGGKFINPQDACNHIIQLINDGADMIDIGAESSRPFSQPVEPDEQISRLKIVLEFIQKENIKTPVSVDTRSSEVADFALNNGVCIINDVSGLEYDKKMTDIISKYNAGVIIQHTKGTPDIMQNSPFYTDVTEEVYKSLKSKKEYAESLGINNIILDPGIGFGKQMEDNFILINRAKEFFSLNKPIMFGVSRKSFLGVQENNNEIKDILTGVISYPMMKIGVDYLRVHNVKLHKMILKNLLNFNKV